MHWLSKSLLSENRNVLLTNSSFHRITQQILFKMTYTGKCQAKKKQVSGKLFKCYIHKTQANLVFDLDIYPK